MKNKIIISLIAIIFSLSGGIAFATPLPEIYDENELMSYTSSDGGLYVRTGLIFNAFDYDESGKLYIEFKKSNNANNITDWSYFSGYSKDYFYFPNYNHSSMTTILLRQVSNPSNTLPLRLHYCSSYVNSLPWNWSMCQYSYSDLQSGAIRVYPYVLGSYTSPNGQYLTKTLIDNYYGTDFLEGNYYFEGVAVWYLNSSSTRNSEVFYVINSELTEFGYDVAYNTFPITPPVVNGSCGSAEGESFPYLDEESENLCATGSVACPYAICYGGDVIDNGTTYYWKCEGSGEGATSEYCLAYVSTATAQCGYASGSYSTIQPTGTDACLYGVITDMTQNADDSWAWDCVVSESDYTSCETIASAPEIPGTLPSDDSIDCDISPTDLSIIGDCLGSVAKWLFLPHQETLNEFFQIPTTLQKKSPFGYFYAVGNLFKNLTTTPPSDLEFTMKNVDSTNMTLWKYSDFADFVGSENVKIYFSLIRALLWIGFAYWIYSKGRSLFNNSDSEK